MGRIWQRGLAAAAPGNPAFWELEKKNWERGAEVYHDGFGPLTRQSTNALLDACGLREGGRGKRLLDVATGPGYVGEVAFLERRACVVGIDFSESMLALARERLHYDLDDGDGCPAVAEDGASLWLQPGDAEAMPFEAGEFDAVTCGFGILHLGEPDRFLREAWRCLRPGGRLAFSVWAAPPATEAFDMLLRAVQVAGNPDVPLPPGPPFFRFADAAEVHHSLEEAGFVKPEVVEVPQEWHVFDSEALFEIYAKGTARTRALLEGQTEQELAALKAHLAESMAARPAGPLRMPAVVSSAEKPALPSDS